MVPKIGVHTEFGPNCTEKFVQLSQKSRPSAQQGCLNIFWSKGTNCIGKLWPKSECNTIWSANQIQGTFYYYHVRDKVYIVVLAAGYIRKTKYMYMSHIGVQSIKACTQVASKSTLRRPLNLRLFTLLLPAKVLLRLLHKI